ncbi:hypothetical protein M431DRAFT_195683 [Trichoderma harzianum CBS 226.95]|uniref:Uncharacterized protein n=1 Tax=Trichoderma harzianum CBS 226.95 TaxID=983964 RepID=A0A2T4AUL4_TRIHA|nr:hypothetical protein M431DRAFT_195683 [Trichoderma harzianum CBS 226.95]PTB60753.1 hypothetical protein M431DRAFT_195683 [Trichoderma harzianum CBS 226.95]
MCEIQVMTILQSKPIYIITCVMMFCYKEIEEIVPFFFVPSRVFQTVEPSNTVEKNDNVQAVYMD